MKKVLFIFSLIFAGLVFIGCSGSDDEPVQPVADKKIPSELIGNWKIKDYRFLHDPNFGHDETAGFYITIQSDNMIKYKDPNGERSGIAFVRDDGNFYLIGQYIDFTVSDSKKFPGQKEFTIRYNNEKIYYSGIMTGTKQ
ncbi:hypothetical protein [Chryseobacterium vrystaatense]|uniref:Lipocalin-like domain-containing protein n=1 Tax=Chryseobacterium vrystaatense TaxID=307480 RepID=A0A1M4ZN37_9FLAO|nr:hypothetical protein [Chryseobacterium vrystaatense]SHF19428.1 hypothetical protein SAMN02787073_1649 [Chryseobacterium vrystaatense]